MKTGVVVALRWEAQCLQSVLKRHSGHTIIWQLTGMGPQAASNGARQLIDDGATQLISFGCAAGLQPNLGAGALLLPRQVVQIDGQRLECESGLWQRFSSESADACHAALAEASMVLNSPEAKSALASSTGAAAADMESAAVLHVAHQHELPGLVMRTVLDNAAQSLPAGLTDCCDSWGSPRPLPFAGWLLREPTRLSAVYALARAQRKARQTLSHIAETLVRMS